MRTDDLGQRAVVALNFPRHLLASDERRAEENEGVGWTGDIGSVSFLAMGSAAHARRSRGRIA